MTAYTKRHKVVVRDIVVYELPSILPKGCAVAQWLVSTVST